MTAQIVRDVAELLPFGRLVLEVPSLTDRDDQMTDPSLPIDPSAAATFVSIVWMLCAWWAGKTRDMP